MKKLFTALTMLALCAGARSTPARAQVATARTASDKAAIVQRYYWYEELLASANSEDVIAMQTDNFVNVGTDDETLNREQSDAMVRIDVDSVHRVHGVNVRINRLAIHGDHAIVVVTQYTDTDRKDATGTIRRVISNGVMRQLWTRTENGWQIQRSKTLRAEINIDGHVVRI